MRSWFFTRKKREVVAYFPRVSLIFFPRPPIFFFLGLLCSVFHELSEEGS